MFDVSKLTLDEVGGEISKTIDKLERLQNLYAAMMNQEHRRVEKLIQEWNAAVEAEKQTKAKYVQENHVEGGE